MEKPNGYHACKYTGAAFYDNTENNSRIAKKCSTLIIPLTKKTGQKRVFIL